jgi:hypothetical protein
MQHGLSLLSTGRRNAAEARADADGGWNRMQQAWTSTVLHAAPQAAAVPASPMQDEAGPAAARASTRNAGADSSCATLGAAAGSLALVAGLTVQYMRRDVGRPGAAFLRRAALAALFGALVAQPLQRAESAWRHSAWAAAAHPLVRSLIAHLSFKAPAMQLFALLLLASTPASASVSGAMATQHAGLSHWAVAIRAAAFWPVSVLLSSLAEACADESPTARRLRTLSHALWLVWMGGAMHTRAPRRAAATPLAAVFEIVKATG